MLNLYVSIIRPIVEKEQSVDFSNIDLGLPTSSGRTSKFESKPVDELTYELDKADQEFKFKAANPGYKRKFSSDQSDEPREELKIKKEARAQPKWRSIEENSGFTEIKEEATVPEEKVPEQEPPPRDDCIEHCDYKLDSLPVVKTELVPEKVVTLNSSSKKQKVVGFKKRKTDPSSQNLRERKLDD